MVGQTQFTVKATLAFDEKGNPIVNAKVAGVVAYGGRTASTDVDIVDPKTLDAVGAALAKVLTDDIKAKLTQEATVAGYEALVVATRKGESV